MLRRMSDEKKLLVALSLLFSGYLSNQAFSVDGDMFATFVCVVTLMVGLIFLVDMRD